ncbi:hypothetical protein C1H46_014908 [Malus baccata]|uniref:DUF7733 domain-containing protein n=1 Tax=Malus baccata TaxID=106549 RepID=A0A540MKX6_MALBA|nr:hypothetical protein C1H46_014908 [Malus baccata]
MSGGVGPTYNDITLSREQEQEQLQHELVKQSKTDPTSSKLKRFGVLPFWQINALAIIILGIKAATPPVFLFACQLFMDGVVFGDRFSTPIRIFVPVLYNSKRIFTLVDWLRSEFSKQDEEVYGGSARRLYVGRVLVVVNLAFWSFNLFGCLLPVYLPKAFKKYYSAYSLKSKIEDVSSAFV